MSISWLQHEVPWPAEACEGHSHGPAAAVSTLRAVSSCKHRATQAAELLSSLSKHFLFHPISLDESSWYLYHVFPHTFLSLFKVKHIYLSSFNLLNKTLMGFVLETELCCTDSGWDVNIRICTFYHIVSIRLESSRKLKLRHKWLYYNYILVGS